MQDRYAGDVGDFGKFGLLRHLLSGLEGPSSLGVVWYFYVPHDESNNDGRHIGFYNDLALTNCDTDLAKKLQDNVLLTTQRSVASLEKSKILPSQTKYFRKNTNFYAASPGQKAENKIAREKARDLWLKQALETVQGCRILFLDPDNGLEIASCAKKSQKKAGKFAYLDEVKTFKEQAPVVIVYHHLNMGSQHELQIERGVARLTDTFQGSVSVYALRFRPYSPRAFFILCSPEIDEVMSPCLDNFLQAPWGQYWNNFVTRHAEIVHSAKADASM